MKNPKSPRDLADIVWSQDLPPDLHGAELVTDLSDTPTAISFRTRAYEVAHVGSDFEMRVEQSELEAERHGNRIFVHCNRAAPWPAWLCQLPYTEIVSDTASVADVSG